MCWKKNFEVLMNKGLVDGAGGIDRRAFLRGIAAGAGGFTVAGCSTDESNTTSESVTTTEVTPAGEPADVVVDFGATRESATHNANGFLYGLSYDGQDPSDKWLAALQPGLFVGGGARVEGGAWALDGETGYEKRWRMVEQQYERIRTLPGDPEYVIRISDLWGADAVRVVDEDHPWPGDGGNWDKWDALLERIVSDVTDAGMDPNAIQFEIWNEPNYELFWKRSQERFRELWRRGVRTLRELYPRARIVGPNYTHLLPDLRNRFEEWLQMTIDTGTVPDIVNWHDLQEWNDPVADATVVREILDKHDLDLPLEINEYLPRSQLNAGYDAWDLVRIDKANVQYAALGVWTECCSNPRLVGLLTPTDDGLRPSGRWWVHRRYASMTGDLVETSGTSHVDAVAGTCPAEPESVTARTLLGTNGQPETVTVDLRGLGTRLAAESRVEIALERIPDAPVVDEPEIIRQRTITAPADTHRVSIPWNDRLDAYAISIGTDPDDDQ